MRPVRVLPWQAVVAVLVAGLAGGLVATVAGPAPAAPAAVTRWVTLGMGDQNGRVEYAAVVENGRNRQVPAGVPFRLAVPAMVVVTVRSTVEPQVWTQHVSCRITVDGHSVYEQWASGGRSATCARIID